MNRHKIALISVLLCSFPLLVAAYQGQTIITDTAPVSLVQQFLFALPYAWQWSLALTFLMASAVIVAGTILQFSNDSNNAKGRQLLWSGLIIIGVFAYFFYTTWDEAGFLLGSDYVFLPWSTGGHWIPDTDKLFVFSSFVTKIAFALACGLISYRISRSLRSMQRYLWICTSAGLLIVFAAIFIFTSTIR